MQNMVYDERLCMEKHKTILQRIDLCIEKVEARLNAMDKALIVQKEETERRLEGLNQLRADVVSDRDLFVRKDTYDSKIKTYDDWIPVINKRVTVMETRSVVWAAAIAAFFIIVNIALHLWK